MFVVCISVYCTSSNTSQLLPSYNFNKSKYSAVYGSAVIQLPKAKCFGCFPIRLLCADRVCSTHAKSF